MPIPQLLVTRFFQLLTQRSITEAERVLEKIEEKANKNDERTMGYMSALEGALIAFKSNDDRYAFILKIEPDDKNVNRFKSEFLKHSRSEIHAAYDRGYFAAWSEYMRVLSKIEVKQNKIAEDSLSKVETKTPEKDIGTMEKEAKATPQGAMTSQVKSAEEGEPTTGRSESKIAIGAAPESRVKNSEVKGMTRQLKSEIKEAGPLKGRGNLQTRLDNYNYDEELGEKGNSV